MSAPMNWIRSFTTRWAVSFLISGLLCLLFPGSSLANKPILRKVLVLYNSETEQSPTMNTVFRSCQTILNYYGILTEYRDVAKRPLPNPQTMSTYRGIITTFHSEKMKAAKEYLVWLIRQFDAGKKVVVLDQLGCTAKRTEDPALKELIDKTFDRMGLRFGAQFTGNQSTIRYVYKDKAGVGFERKYPPIPMAYQMYAPVGKGVRTYLSIKRKDKKDSTSSVIITSPTGGFAWSNFLIWEDHRTKRRSWYVNPFLFFEEALDLKGIPRPDPTTLNGLRVAFSHIDADGFGGPSRIDKRSLCAEIIRDEILKKYDFPVTVSVMTGEIDPDALGNDRVVRLAKEIFRLPNVEPASHSYSHPFYWDPEYEHKDWYDHQYGIKIPRYTHDPKTEIDHSVKYITEELAPPGKPCRVMLWTGNCEPTESDIARCDALGVLNMNGGDTVFDGYNDSYTSVAPLYRQVGSRFQAFTGQANENILTNLWKGPYYGYRKIITTMKRTGYPRRLKPIDIYYHFYSGEYHASLKALQDVYEWVSKQDIAPVFTSDYIRMVLGFTKTRMQLERPGKYVIEDYGHCLTIRFDSERGLPDLGQCENVLGYAREPQGLYVSLVPGKKRAVITLSDTRPASKAPYVEKASGWVGGFSTQGGQIRLEYRGYGVGRLQIAGLEPKQSFRISGSAIGSKSRLVTSDEKGGILIKKITAGTMEVIPR